VNAGVGLIGAALLAAACTSPLKRPEAVAPAPVVKAAVQPVSPPVIPDRPAVAEPLPRPTESPLAAGLAAYENGDYPLAQQKLQATLDRGGSVQEKVAAHKHLAFMACAASRMDACEAHFRQVLALDGRHTLSPAEAGHPRWGPLFRKLRAEAARAQPR
jgi:hypothetical protein